MKKSSLIYVLFTALVFAAMEPVSKLLGGRADALTVTFARFLLGSLVLMPLAAFTVRRRGVRLSGRDYLFFTLQGVLSVCVSMGLLQLAVFKAESPAMVAVVFCSNSVLTVLLAAPLLHEKLTPRRALACLIAMAGVALFGVGAGRAGTQALLLALCAAAAMSLFTVLGKKYAHNVPYIVKTGYSFALGTVALGAVLLFSGKPLLFMPESIQSAAALVFLGAAVTGAGYITYFKAMETGGTLMASLVFFIKPVLSPVMAYLILGKGFFNAQFCVSLALVTLGSALLVFQPKRKA